MKSVLIGLYILFAECIYALVIVFIAYFFCKFFWNKEKVIDQKTGKTRNVVKEKPNKMKVLYTIIGIWVIVLIADILCAFNDIELVAAKRIYPINKESRYIEGIYPRFLYNMQISPSENSDFSTDFDVKLNPLFIYSIKDLNKTVLKMEVEKNKPTYSDEHEEEKVNTETDNTINENVVENTVENTIENTINNTVENKVENVVGNKIENSVSNKTSVKR